jgi:Myristoyl-CoA:protein N-myristoyltransferase, N-terminal domain
MHLHCDVYYSMRVLDKTVKTVEINFLCVHKKLRSKRLAPVLIKEVTRRVNRSGVWQVSTSNNSSIQCLHAWHSVYMHDLYVQRDYILS